MRTGPTADSPAASDEPLPFTVENLVKLLGFDHAQAEEAVAIAKGEIDGDVVQVKDEPKK